MLSKEILTSTFKKRVSECSAKYTIKLNIAAGNKFFGSESPLYPREHSELLPEVSKHLMCYIRAVTGNYFFKSTMKCFLEINILHSQQCLAA